MPEMQKHSRVFVAGHRGLVGSAIVRALRNHGYSQILTRTRQELDLQDRAAVERFFSEARPEFVFSAAARVGGILANATQPVEFLRDNVDISLNLIEAAWRSGTRKFLFLGSSCIYPKFAPQPLREEYLLSGPLEPTNQWYAIAKIAGIKLAQAYRQQYGFNTIALMPTNLYGPGDNFDPHSAHVIPGLLYKFHMARQTGASEVTVWGTGSPRREFLYVDDLAEATIHLMLHYEGEEILNVGTGHDISIADLAKLIADVTEFTGKIVFDTAKPDGTPRKLLDVSRVQATGWQARTPLTEGLRETYSWYSCNAGAPVSLQPALALL